MQLYPTRSAFHVALAGAALVTVGVAAREPALAAFGGAMVLAVALGRVLAQATVARIRSSGFEMVWTTTRRVTRLGRGGELILEAELRNRGADDARAVNLRALCSSLLEARVEPAEIELPAGSKVRVDVHVKANRVGRWGVHGVALEVRGTPLGGEGLYEVPLLFANPHGLEVLPPRLLTAIESPRGGRSRALASRGLAGDGRGESDELRELRDHVPGDAFKRIAWKASARRRKLVVREMEREERDVVWLVLDASVELWAGEPGTAPLDHAVDAVGALAARHLARGDLVGLGVVASRTRSWVTADEGPSQLAKVASSLASAASMVDSDRSEADEQEVAARVMEHARPLDGGGLADLRRGDLDALAARADSLRSRAPFVPRAPFAKTAREQRLRHYCAAFGIELPPRVDGEREQTDVAFGRALEDLLTERPAPTVVHVLAQAPVPGGATERALLALKRRRVAVLFTLPEFDASVQTALASNDTSRQVDRVYGGLIGDAVRARVRASKRRAERQLRRLGVKLRPAKVRATTDTAGEPALPAPLGGRRDT
ncbi:MAG: DUF58 domain-containing protein [Myxococcales bacterium]|nr:DUF58 domain-containing protein [Myxococcales bacterium]MBL0195122.1 DUF58 domain-containing protein [Myxococcales bacterium]HQY62863.1 DUF58 domain-containing protein [Polyangiaceae bacterium]